jgi:hypothetical protein
MDTRRAWKGDGVPVWNGKQMVVEKERKRETEKDCARSSMYNSVHAAAANMAS